MEADSNQDNCSAHKDLAHLQLLHLADSALPIGALSHSFGLETLVAAEILNATTVPTFLRGFLQEAGPLEAAACREAFQLGAIGDINLRAARWLEINDYLSALKPARESRAASAVLGRNFLQAALRLGDFPVLREARDASFQSASLIHHSAGFGLVSAALELEESRVVLAYLHQMTASLVSACQRLLPIGQNEATRMLWDLKPAILEAAKVSAGYSLEEVNCFMPLLDWGAMEHPTLATRLFIS
jgi:urease accessory protein